MFVFNSTRRHNRWSGISSKVEGHRREAWKSKHSKDIRLERKKVLGFWQRCQVFARPRQEKDSLTSMRFQSGFEWLYDQLKFRFERLYDPSRALEGFLNRFWCNWKCFNGFDPRRIDFALLRVGNVNEITWGELAFSPKRFHLKANHETTRNLPSFVCTLIMFMWKVSALHHVMANRLRDVSVHFTAGLLTL